MNQKQDSLRILKMLSDKTRLEILRFLLNGEKCVCEIIPHTKRTQSTVSIQLSKLEKAGLLKSRKDGRKVFYRIDDYRVCDIFKSLGFVDEKILKKKCCMEK